MLDFFDVLKESKANSNEFFILHNQFDEAEGETIGERIKFTKLQHDDFVKFINKSFKQAYSVSHSIPERYVSLKFEREYLENGEEKVLTINSELYDRCIQAVKKGDYERRIAI